MSKLNSKEMDMSVSPADLKSEPKKTNTVKTFFIKFFAIALLVVCTASFTFIVASQDKILNAYCSNDFLNNLQILKCDNTTKNQSDAEEFKIKTSEEGEGKELVNSYDVSAIFDLAHDSVVGVGVMEDDAVGSETSIIGTGFVISEDGLIATNRHVVSETGNGTDYYITFPNKETPVKVDKVYEDRVNDIALLKIKADNLKGLVLGDSNSLKPGQLVVAIGNPLGDLTSSVTSGIVSGLKRTVVVSDNSFLRTEVSRFEDTIQTDAAINPGNSGGPLLNSKGEVVGINFATLQGADNLSFAIPVSYLKTRVAELNKYGRFRIPYLGVEYSTNQYIFDNEVIFGARVVRVDPDSAAGGVLQVRDVIIEFDAKKLEEDSLAKLIQTTEIGKTVKIKVIRNNKVITLDVKVGERK